MLRFIRALPMPVEDFLDEWFESPVLKGALGASGVAVSQRGPRSSGTGLMMLYQATRGGSLPWGIRYVQGGIGNLSEALASCARERGVEICTGTSVSHITIKSGVATGVELESGERIDARVIVSSLDPSNTFFKLVGAPNLQVHTVRELKNIRFRGGPARVNLALSRLPEFPIYTSGSDSIDPISRLTGRIVIAPDLEYIEKAYDRSKYGELPNQLFMDIAIPTLLDATLAPSGEHLICINVHYAPYKLNGGWEACREMLWDRVIETLQDYAPGFKESVIQYEVLTPPDLEFRFGMTQGDINHGQMDLDQLLFMRPIPGYSRYRSPVEHLYLCGAGTHPGGGLTGAPGYNAAREIEKDFSRGLLSK
jgi:phytoene dehydrogenase-like protein